MKMKVKYLTVLVFLLFLASCATRGTALKETVPDDAGKADKTALAAASPDKAELMENVGAYMKAWQKQDYEAMYSMEAFTEDNRVKPISYAREFDPKFDIRTWKVSLLKKHENKDGYKVFVLVEHPPMGPVAAMVPKGTIIRNTLVQNWKRGNDGYLHVYRAPTSKADIMKGKY